MEQTILDIIMTFWIFYIYLLLDVSTVDAFDKGVLYENKNGALLHNENFLSKIVPLENSDISPETSDQVMSTEYMFNLLDKLENGEDVQKASGIFDGDGVLEKADTIRSFSSKATKYNQVYDMYRFKIHSLSVEEQIKRVELRLRNSNGATRRKTRVKYLIKQNKHVLVKFRSREDIRNDGKYSIIDLSKTINSILNKVHGNVTIKISVRSSNRLKNTDFIRNANLEYTNNGIGSDRDALLILYSEDSHFMQKMYNQFMQKGPVEKHSRSKRAIRQRRKKKNRTRGKRKRKICQLEDFSIDFNHLGWGEWVVYPKDFNAKICTGVCPSPVKDKFTPTNHAMLQSLMRLGQPKIAPMPCCVPTKLRPLKLLYYEKDEIIVRLHEDMVATSCGCR